MSARATPTRPDRPARAQRPRTPTLPEAQGFEALDQEHRALVTLLDRLDALVARLDGGGPDEEARALARAVLAHFEGPGAQHHAHEEQFVFPELLAFGDTQLTALVQRLQQDHHWIELDWRELEPHVRTVAEGLGGYELALLQAAVPVFRALLLEHMALEERVVYPAARRVKAERAAARERRLEQGRLASA